MRLWAEAITIGDLVDRAAAEGEGDALIFPDGRAGYSEFAQAADGWACALRALGVEPGDKVGILMPNCLDFAVAFVATAKLGAVSVPVNARFKPHELSHVIEHADIRVLVSPPAPRGRLTSLSFSQRCSLTQPSRTRSRSDWRVRRCSGSSYT